MRGMAPERSAANSKEVEELRKAGIDCYSLSEIDWKVDSLFDFKIKCFLDACKGYHQIQMIKEDEHKTADDVPPDSDRRPPLRARKVIYKLAVQPSPLNSSITIEACGREDTPPSGFSTLTPLPSLNMGELPPIIASTFTVRSPKNTPLTNRASTSSNLDLISPAFVEANYEVLASLLRDARRYVHNEDLHTKLDYYSEDYDEEREMEPRPVRARETTHFLRTGSPMFKDIGEGLYNFKILRTEMGAGLKGNPMARPSEQRIENGRSRGGNHPSLLAAHLGRSENGQPLQSTLTSGYGGNQPSTNSRGISLLMSSFVEAIIDGSLFPVRDARRYVHNEDLHTKLDYYSEDYDEEREMEPRPVRARETTHFLRTGSPMFEDIGEGLYNFKILRTEMGAGLKGNPMARPSEQRVENGWKILRLHEEHCIYGFVHGLKTRSLVEFLSTDLPTTYKGLMGKLTLGLKQEEESGHVAKTFEQPPRMVGNRRSRDMSKYCHFHKDHRHETNQCQELRHQIEEAVKLGKLDHLVKGIKKGKAKAFDTQLGE
ncbi:hypothetical protein Tco_0290615 [Tanacetum coccineum]